MPVRSEIELLERQFWQSMLDRDVDAASALIAESFIVTGAQGVAVMNRDTFVKVMADGQWTLHSFSFEDVEIVHPTKDVAVIGYRVRETVTVDGEKLTITCADASTWVRGPDGWLCVLHTEALEGDPYGRDRRPKAA